MMRYDALNSHVYLVRTEMTGTKHIPISHVCSTDEIKPKEFLVERTLSQVYYTDKNESKGIIADEISTEESES